MPLDSTREKMSAVDTAWLRMDRPHNLMMICGVLLFREPVELKRMRELVRQRFLVFARFRQRAVEAPGGAFWETDPHFDLSRHVASARLPGRAGQSELQRYVSKLIATPLSRARPMWQFHLIANYGGGSALIARIHHSYADGMALVRVMLSMTDASPDGPPAMPFAPEARARRESDRASGRSRNTLNAALKVGSILLEKGAALLADPAKAAALAARGSAFTTEIAKLARMPKDSPTRFKGAPGKAKRVAWAQPLPLSEVKTLGRALGASVNDVMLSCVAGAIRRYLAEKGDAVAGVTLRALVPVNLRPMEEACQLGNRFGLVFLDLPIGIENPVARLYAVRANMHALKGSYQPILAMGVLAAMGTGPKALQEALLHALSRKASAVMTNVPGPQQPLYLAGAKIDSLMFWVPQSGDIGMGVSILSYDGAVQFGLLTDRGLCPDPERIIARFGSEFDTLLLTTLMASWPRDGNLDPDEAAVAAGVFGG
ncbi:MAG: wax ester/triacylglycerol synthase family O-acyltransferase [Betaproteobacteria bacterium]|nr:wax ester/triacylglycerol synthase family O-acyltransferase [Betaproteobacteria bacterium]